MTPRELLEAGRARLVKKGWCRGWGRSNGRACALGSLRWVQKDGDLCYPNHPDHDTYKRAAKYLQSALPSLSKAYGVMGYNDSIADNINDILALFDRAIAKAKECEESRDEKDTADPGPA